MIEQIYHTYTDTAGYRHWFTTGDGTTGGTKEYTNAPKQLGNKFLQDNYSRVKNCPKCGRRLTDNPLCKCGKNNASIML